MSGRVLLVTGTDTGVGKTMVTAALAAAYRASGRSVCVVKPVQTGVTPDEPGDVEEVRRLAGPVGIVEPVRLLEPLAPYLAARVAGVELPTLAEQRDTVLEAVAAYDVVLVEGAGGVTVRLGADWSLLELGLHVDAQLGARLAGSAAERAGSADGPSGVGFVVVVRPGLGTLNHSVLTVQAIQARGLKVAGLVLGSWPAAPGLTERLNRVELPVLTGALLLGALPDGASLLPDFAARAPGWFAALP